jgi:hypothetical protein
MHAELQLDRFSRGIFVSSNPAATLQAYFHPNNVVVVGLTSLHRVFRGSSVKNEKDGSESITLEVKYSQVC